MRIFLAGWTGFVGRHVTEALLAKGHEIVCLVHKKAANKQKSITEVDGDATKLESFEEVVHGCDATINLIGIIREFSSRNITFERLHVEATANILKAAKNASVKRHIQMSALGTKVNANSGYFRSKFKAEELVKHSGLNYTIFRPSIIFGPNDDFINKLADYIKTFPVMPVIGDGKYQMQPISVYDLANCFVDALDNQLTFGKTFEISGPDRMTYNMLLDTIGKVLGKKNVPKINNPLSLMRFVVPFMQRFDFFPITKDQLEMLVEGNVSNNDWQKTFKFELTKFEEGIRKYLIK